MECKISLYFNSTLWNPLQPTLGTGLNCPKLQPAAWGKTFCSTESEWKWSCLPGFRLKAARHCGIIYLHIKPRHKRCVQNYNIHVFARCSFSPKHLGYHKTQQPPISKCILCHIHVFILELWSLVLDPRFLILKTRASGRSKKDRNISRR